MKTEMKERAEQVKVMMQDQIAKQTKDAKAREDKYVSVAIQNSNNSS
jgi:hypothetical protein